MSRAIFLCCALAWLLGCASRAGWMEGDSVNEEVRRVLVSETAGDMGIAAGGVLYLVPPGAVEPERRAFLHALARAEAIRPSPHAPVDMREGEVASGKPLPPRPRPEEAVRAYRVPDVVEIRYPGCTCRVRRFEVGDGGLYSVDLLDRKSGSDRGYAYHMGLVPSPALDRAWDALVAAARRGTGYFSIGSPPSPLDTLRELGVDQRGS